MITFKDAMGREWPLDVNVLTIRRVRQQTKVDLLKAVDGTLQQSLAEVDVLADVLVALLEDELKKHGVGVEQFVVSLRGDAIERATDALMEAIAEFFPTRQGTLLRQMNTKAREAADLAAAEMTGLLQKLDASAFLDQASAAATTADAPSPEAQTPAAASRE